MAFMAIVFVSCEDAEKVELINDAVNSGVEDKNSEILFISAPENILVLKGSLPGKKDNLLRIAPVD